jgi:dUTP pyrophosphatase
MDDGDIVEKHHVTNKPQFQVKLLHKNATLPRRGTSGSAGWDLYACLNGLEVLSPHKATTISTQCAFCIPPGWYGRIAPRSSIAVHGIDVGGGVIDCDYRGEVKVILLNTSAEPRTLIHGDKIAQIIFEKYATEELVEVKDFGENEKTERGTKGFGSTGK